MSPGLPKAPGTADNHYFFFRELNTHVNKTSSRDVVTMLSHTHHAKDYKKSSRLSVLDVPALIKTLALQYVVLYFNQDNVCVKLM